MDTEEPSTLTNQVDITNGMVEDDVGMDAVEHPSDTDGSDLSHDKHSQAVEEKSPHNEDPQLQNEDNSIEFLDNLKQENGVGYTDVGSDTVNSLREQLSKLSKDIEEQKLTQKAAEAALQHLNVAYAESESKNQELTSKLKAKEKEISERDEKYTELDTKFQRLHKRAKQRIQDVQKEKDDLEARFNDLTAKYEQAAAQQAQMQQELEHAHQQASETLRSMEIEKQQLRATNSKLRDSIDEMRHSLDSKNSALEKLEQSIFDKDQMLEQLQTSLQSAEEKRQSSVTDLTSKNQKQLESLQAHLAEVLAERNKAAETISSLQLILSEKDAEIAEIEAASTGEVARLKAALEEVKGELFHIKDQHERERQSWEVTSGALRTKLEGAENACIRAELESSKVKSQLEGELSKLSQLLHEKDSEVATAKDEIKRLESEFSAYKVRAHALLQKKDAELNAAKNSDLVKEHEEAIKEAEKVVMTALMECEKAKQDLQDALSKRDEEIAARDAACEDIEKRLKNTERELDSRISQYRSDKESWEKELASVEEKWSLKCEALELKSKGDSEDAVHKDLEEYKIKYEKLKEEHESFRDIADRMIEEKERELSKLREETKNLLQSSESKKRLNNYDREISVSVNQDAQVSGIAAAEQQILLLARQQAQREEELAQSQRHILALQQEIEELERENRLHGQQEAMLKTELRNMDRSQRREGIDMTYLKNVILKLLETGEVGALLPVVATLLQFSPEEIKRCQQSYRQISSNAGPDGGPSPQSFFSRFTF